MTATGKGTLTRAAAVRFEGRGFTVVPGLFGYGEIARPCAEFAALHAAGPVPGHFAPDAADPDPLRRRPRVMHPHELSPLAREFLLDARLRSVLEALFGEEVPAAQSAFYFKPPGTRGQALYQDNFCLRVACEPIDRGDGGLEVVPVDLAPGDVLFFNGGLVHGAGPNRSADRLRRSFIGHYVGRSARRIGARYRTLTMSGARTRVRAARSSRRTDRTEFDRAGLSDR